MIGKKKCNNKPIKYLAKHNSKEAYFNVNLDCQTWPNPPLKPNVAFCHSMLT